MDGVGGFLIADTSRAKALTGIDDHSLDVCVSAQLMGAERTRLVCDGLSTALHSYGVPEQILTDNRQSFHRQVSPSIDRGAIRSDLPGERDRSSFDPATLANHYRQD